MEKIFNWISIITGVIGGVAVQLTGGFDVMLKVLVIMMVFDYISGVIKGIYTKTLSSNIGFKGLLKKVMVLIIVCTANILQKLTGGSVAIREIVIMFYIANEGISLLENSAEFIPLPEKLKEILLQLRGEE